MPAGFEAPSPDQYYRALDAVAERKEATETELYAALCDLRIWICGWSATT